jgi:predicted MFS family arabinose efflux permease
MTTMTSAIPVPTIAVARPRLFTAPVLRLYLLDFAAMSSFYLLLSVVPMLVAERGIGELGAGLSTGVLMFAAVGAETATPWLAARLGYRRLLVVGLVLLGAPALALPALTGLGALVAVSVVRGFGFAIVVVAAGAMVTWAIPEQRRGEGLGLMGVVAMLPAVVMLPLGVWLTDRAGFVVVCAVAAVAALAAAPLVPAVEGATDDGHAPGRDAGIRAPGLLRPVVVFAATAIAGGVVVAFLPTAVSTQAAVPALFAQSAAATAVRWLAGRYCDRRPAAGLLVPAVLLTAAGIAMAALTGSTAAVVAGMVVFGAGFGLAQAASLNAMLQRARPSQYGHVNAAWNAAYDFGWGAGAIGIGVVVTTAGHATAFAVTAALTLLAIPTAVRARR